MFVSVAPRSLPLVLYPPKAMSVLQISVDAFSSQIFRLWISENVNADGVQIYNQAHAGPQEWIPEDNGRLLSSRQVDGEILQLEAIVQVEEDHLVLRYDLSNTGDATLEGLRIGTCYQLSEASNFRDQVGDRTYAWVGGRLANIAAEGIPAECHDHHDPGRSSFMKMPDPEIGEAAIAVEAVNGGATVMAWETHNEYTGNTDPALNCIHGGPMAPRLEPGEKRSLHGWLGWSAGPVDPLCTRALAAVSAAAS
jgi:hypothetical protein